jgi:hypothetical protein
MICSLCWGQITCKVPEAHMCAVQLQCISCAPNERMRKCSLHGIPYSTVVILEHVLCCFVTLAHCNAEFYPRVFIDYADQCRSVFGDSPRWCTNTSGQHSADFQRRGKSDSADAYGQLLVTGLEFLANRTALHEASLCAAMDYHLDRCRG